MLTEIHDFDFLENPSTTAQERLIFRHPRLKSTSRRFIMGSVETDAYRQDSRPTRVVQRNAPTGTPIVDAQGFSYWFYKQRCYRTKDADRTPDDVHALINEKENRRRIRLEKAHALKSMVDELDHGSRRTSIVKDVKLTVWQRDKGRCVHCGSQKLLEFDHIIPVAMGGSNGERNIQLLCQECNRRKGASLG